MSASPRARSGADTAGADAHPRIIFTPRIIFIAAPFRAPTEWQRRRNVLAAEAVALEVWLLGAVAVCPQANSAHFQDEIPDEVFLAGYQALLNRCDAVLVPGAITQGVAAEIAAATIPVMHSLAELTAWLRS